MRQLGTRIIRTLRLEDILGVILQNLRRLGGIDVQVRIIRLALFVIVITGNLPVIVKVKVNVNVIVIVIFVSGDPPVVIVIVIVNVILHVIDGEDILRTIIRCYARIPLRQIACQVNRLTGLFIRVIDAELGCTHRIIILIAHHHHVLRRFRLFLLMEQTHKPPPAAFQQRDSLVADHQEIHEQRHHKQDECTNPVDVLA